MHYPVMASEALEHLAIRPDGVYVDCTAGLGGHTRMIAERLQSGKVIARDRDPISLEMAAANTAEVAERIQFQHGAFSELESGLAEVGLEKVDGLLADLGVSRYQLTSPDRGFSFSAGGPLDMRMDPTVGTTAEELVNYSAEKALADLIFQLGEERRARKIARAIVRARPIRSAQHLADVVQRAVPRTSRIHPATQTFQALRMTVNQEQSELDSLLRIAPEVVKGGGRIVIISFMSLEDRKVKERFRELGREGRAVILTKRPLQPSEQETRENPASRSAKLRALEMVETR